MKVFFPLRPMSNLDVWNNLMDIGSHNKNWDRKFTVTKPINNKPTTNNAWRINTERYIQNIQKRLSEFIARRTK